MKIQPNTKIKICSEEHSEYVQKIAFDSGFSWLGVNGKVAEFKGLPYLFFDDQFTITHAAHADVFRRSKSKEIFINLPVEKPRHRVPTESSVRIKSITHFNRALSEEEMIEITKPSMPENCRCVTVEISRLKEKPRHRVSIESRVLAEKVGGKHSHYFKDVSGLDEIDVYKVCELFEINDPSGAKQHAIKKLLCSGQRGAKGERKDLEEARDTIVRKLSMMTVVDNPSPQIDLDSEPPVAHDAYDELREANLELAREAMAKEKEIELLKQRINVLERAKNDAKAALDV